MTVVYHTYRTACSTVRLPPGFGDFLRGSIALAILSKQQNFDLRLDFSEHPIAGFLRDVRPPEPPLREAFEFFNERMDLLPSFLITLEPDACVAITTHLHPDLSRLNDEARMLVLSQLPLNETIEMAAESLARRISADRFGLLHVRVTDGESGVGPEVLQGLSDYINGTLVPKWGRRFAVISNSMTVKVELSNSFDLPLIDTQSAHLGDCAQSDANVRDTLIDFALLSRASEIHAWSYYKWKSGFSYWCARLHGIPFFDVNPPAGSSSWHAFERRASLTVEPTCQPVPVALFRSWKL